MTSRPPQRMASAGVRAAVLAEEDSEDGCSSEEEPQDIENAEISSSDEEDANLEPSLPTTSLEPNLPTTNYSSDFLGRDGTAWSEILCSTPGRANRENIFREHVGVRTNVKVKVRTPYDAWKEFFTEPIIRLVVKHTDNSWNKKKSLYFADAI